MEIRNCFEEIFTRMAHMVFCTKYKAELEGLDEPPFDSDFGNKIYKNVSKKGLGRVGRAPEDAAK